MDLKAGRLRNRIEVRSLDYDLSSKHVCNAWVSIASKENADVAYPDGLRANAKVVIWSRYNKQFKAGQYLKYKDRLFRFTSVRDIDGLKTKLVSSADEFIGDTAMYNGKQIRIHLTHSAPYYDDFGKVTDYRIKAEVLLFETGRVQAGDSITVDGKSYIVTQYADGTDDGVVRGLWLDEA